MKPSGIITFLSDFGHTDWFVAAVKGEILKINKQAKIIDITHTIRPHDIQRAAFILSQCYKNFPKGTVHLAVVDPGVGSIRRPIGVVTNGHVFIAPDNGVLSYVMDQETVVYHIPAPEKASATFHARDVFGPAAAHFSRGNTMCCKKLSVRDCECLIFPRCHHRNDTIQGEIVYIDYFGNCITNLPVDNDVLNCCIRKTNIPVREYYAEGQENEIIAVRGSSGFYEITVNKGSAEHLLKVRVGTRITAYIDATH